jgi:lysine-N-methylase
VRARRHLRTGGSTVVLHDDQNGRALVIGEREWNVVRAMDGTRDLVGIAMAAEHNGAPVRADHLAAFVASLESLGMLDSYAPPVPPDNAFPRDVPVRALADYRFACDGAGECCRTYGSVLFTAPEVARACALRPELEDAGHDPGRIFLPAAGLDDTLRAVARRNGACVFLDPEGRCSIHARGGESAKPLGCRTFPIAYLDTGAEIRAVPRPECSCVFEAGGGDPITHATRGGELARETYVPSLPESIAMGPETVDRERFVAFSDSIALGDRDLVLECVALAGDIAARGSSARGRALDRDVSSLRARVTAMRRAADLLSSVYASYHAPSDPIRRSTELVRDALQRLDADLVVPEASQPEDEHLVARVVRFGLRLASGPSVEDALRSLAVRILVARTIDRQLVRHPVAIVEALHRNLP